MDPTTNYPWQQAVVDALMELRPECQPDKINVAERTILERLRSLQPADMVERKLIHYRRLEPGSIGRPYLSPMSITTSTRDQHCTRCSKAVVVRFRLGKTTSLSLTTETILCPWCGHNWTLEIPGKLLWVEKRS
jgi:DNA-directed RNA polymerase subunit RPC12/RpoP